MKQNLFSFEKYKLIIPLLLAAFFCQACGGASAEPSVDTALDEQQVVAEIPPETDSISANASALPEESEPSEEEQFTPEDTDEDIQSAPALISPQTKVRGLYVTGPVAGSERMDEIISMVENTELNTLVIDIKNDEGNLTYKMELPEGYDFEAGVRYVRDMPALLQSLHEKDIYVIGRIVCFKDPILAEAKPELALRKPDGTPIVDANGLSFVNPCKEEVWDYLCTIAETASLDGFDEIQFDYVRFPIGQDAEEADYNVEKTENFRQEHLTEFFKYTSKRLHESNIVYGADLFGTVIGSDVDREQTGQNYSDIVAMCDAVCPMIYPSHYAGGTFGLDVPDAHPYETVLHAMELSNEALLNSPGEQGVIRPWLQCFNAIWVPGHITYDSPQITEQIQAVYDSGCEEWILWNASNHYEQVEAALKAFSAE